MNGVYSIWNETKCLYIGYSNTISDRMSKHRYYFKKPNKCNVKSQREMYEDMRLNYDHIKVHYLELDVNKNRESFWISLLKPKYNGRY